MKITISDTYELPALAVAWMGLEVRAAGGFFLSWRWIATWLRTTGVRPLLVTASEDDVTVALGFLNPHQDHRHFISVRQLCLHETGSPDFDALMIEHNGFLIAHAARPNLIVEIMRALQSTSVQWDEVVLGGVSHDIVSLMQAAGLIIEVDRQSPVFGLDLSDRAAGSSRWKDRLSTNLRAQIRQSQSLAERIGPLVLKQAVSTQQMLEYFENMMGLHTVYWQKRNKPGAFASAFARKFHRELISFHSDQAQIELLELAAGSHVLGYLYNFRYAGRICNYQSGFSYTNDNRHRPGLIAHTMAIEQAVKQGLHTYDFLAGDALYKARFGQHLGSMIWCRAQRNSTGLKVERLVRKLGQSLRRALP